MKKKKKAMAAKTSLTEKFRRGKHAKLETTQNDDDVTFD